MMGPGWGMGWTMGGGLWMLIGLVIIVGLVIFFVMKTSTTGTAHSPKSDQEALEIAKKRLAKGEITPEEFEQIKKNLF